MRKHMWCSDEVGAPKTRLVVADFLWVLVNGVVLRGLKIAYRGLFHNCVGLTALFFLQKMPLRSIILSLLARCAGSMSCLWSLWVYQSTLFKRSNATERRQDPDTTNW